MRIAAWLLVGSLCAACGDDGPSQTHATTGSGGSSTTSSSQGGAGGAAPVCQLGELGSCGDDQKCSVVDPQSGEVGCVATGSAPLWSVCAADSACPELSYCDGLTGVCKPLCDSADDCGDGRCVAAMVKLGDPITGLMLCTAGCNPLALTPCNPSAGAVTCGAHNPGDDTPAFDCLASAGGAEDAPCVSQTATNSRSDCGPGLACVQLMGTGNACKRWCTPPGEQAQCSAGEICTDSGSSQAGIAYGVCP